MTKNIPRPTWRKPPLPKSFWQKFFTGLFGTLGGFLAVIPIPKNIFSRPMSYFVRVSEQKSEEKAEAKDSKQKVKELIKNDVNRQVALWSEAADEEKGTIVYKVLSGDSLWKIAKNQYGNGERWIDIWTANRVAIKEPNLIFAGQELKVPKQIVRRTALFQAPAPAPQKSAVKTAGGELIKKQIINSARSIEQTGLKTVALINQKLITTGITGEQKTITLQVANQINSNIIDARSYARQAQSINDFNANSVDLSVRTLDLGRETIQLARASEAIPSPAMVSNTPAMAWSQDSAGNIKYYTMKNGAWTPSEVNPIGNIGAIYGTQDITQTPEYKNGKIIKISPQSAPAAVAAPIAPAPYGGAVLNIEQQAIYENLKSTRGVAAEQYKQTVLGSSPIVVSANAAVVKADTGVVALNTSVASQTIGESVSAGPAQTSSELQKSITAAAASARAVSGSPVLSETAMAEKLNNFAQASATNAESAIAAHQAEPAVVQAVLATEAAIAANIAAPNSQAAASASEAAGRAIAILQSTNPVEVQRVLIDISGDGSIAPGQSPSGISSQTSSSFDTSVTGSTLSFQSGENTIGHITANPPSGIIGQGVANVTGSNVLGTLANLAVGVVNLFAGVANTAIGVGVNLATGQEISISPFSFATTPQQAWSGLSGTQQGFQTQRAGEIASQNTSQSGVAATAEESAAATVPTTPTASEPSAPGYGYLSMQAKALGISISDVIGNLEATNQITPQEAANLRSIARAEVPAEVAAPNVSNTPNVGLAPADVDTATSAEHGETGAVDDTSDITLGVQGVVGSAYSAVTDMVASESATAAGMTSSEAGARTSAEVAAQNASNPALAGGSMMGNSTSVSTPAGLTGTVGIMSFGAGQLTAVTVTLSNGVTAAFGSNSGTLTSQGLTDSEANEAIALALANTAQALQSQSQPRGSDSDTSPTGLTPADVDVAVTAEQGETDAGPTGPPGVDATGVDSGGNSPSGPTGPAATGEGEGGGPGSGPSGGPSGDAGDGGPGGPSGDGGDY